MKFFLYSLKDTKAGIWLQPMPQRHDTEAQRALVSLMASTDCNVSRFPGDYDLYLIGSFDDTTAMLEAINPKHLMSGTTAASAAKTEYKQYMGRPLVDGQ